MKRACRVCKKEFETSELVKKSSTTLGYIPECYPCYRIKRRQYKDENKAHIREKRREYYERNHEKVLAQKRKTAQNYINKRRENGGYRAWYLANKVRISARDAVKYGLRVGWLVRPKSCPLCKESRYQIEAHHHNGYENKLDIKWMCKRCHESEHHPLEGITRTKQ